MHGLPLDTSINHLRTVTHILNDLERTVAQELGVRRLSWEAYAEKGAFFLALLWIRIGCNADPDPAFV